MDATLAYADSEAWQKYANVLFQNFRKECHDKSATLLSNVQEANRPIQELGAKNNEKNIAIQVKLTQKQ